MTPSGTSLLGLVKHLGVNEYGWFVETLGRQTEPLPFDDDDPEADLRPAADETAEDIVAFYARARTASDSVIADHEPDSVGTAWDGRQVSLRHSLIHMIEETARHVGHIDVVRELLDGGVGDHPEANADSCEQ